MICQELAIHLHSIISEGDIPTFIWATKFISDHFADMSDNQKNVVKKNLPLALSTGNIILPETWSDQSPLVFPAKFNKTKGWQTVFPDQEDQLDMKILSDLYLENDQKSDHEKWKTFFYAIGATRTPYPRRKQWFFWFNIPEDVPPHLVEWASNRNSTVQFCLCDWVAPKWLRCNKTKQEDIDVIRAESLTYWLEAQIDKINSGYWSCEWLMAELKWFYYSEKSSLEISEMNFCLHNSQWVPTTKGLQRPAEVFLDRPDIKEFFGNTVPYLRLKMTDELIKWLNIKTSASFVEVYSLLKSIAAHPAGEADEKFVNRIYAFLNERWKSEVKREFITLPLILVTKPNRRWLRLEEVIWPDRSDVFEDTFGYLEPEYEGLRPFFIEKLGVKERGR